MKNVKVKLHKAQFKSDTMHFINFNAKVKGNLLHHGHTRLMETVDFRAEPRTKASHFQLPDLTNVNNCLS